MEIRECSICESEIEEEKYTVCSRCGSIMHTACEKKFHCNCLKEKIDVS